MQTLNGNDLICGIVVTYHPTPEHFENLRYLSTQVDRVIVIDNGSSPEEIKGLYTIQPELDIVLIANQDNMGIAYALNQGIRWALENNYEWVNIFDQDSCITEGYIKTMVEDFKLISKKARLGLLAPLYRRPMPGKEGVWITEGRLTPFVTMTSGSLFSAEVLRACGLFAEELFIYIVDDEYSLRLRQLGYEIARCKRAFLLHSPGAPHDIKIFGHKLFTVTNHSSSARYYMNRNRIWLFRHYAKFYPRWFARLGLRTVKEALMVIVAEEQKMLKLVRIFQGLKDGLLGKMGRADF